MQIWGRHCTWSGRTPCSRSSMHEPEAIQFHPGFKWLCNGFWLWASNNPEETFLPKSSTQSRGWVLKNALVHWLYISESTLHSSRNLGSFKEVTTLIQGWCESYIRSVRCLEFWLCPSWNVHWFHSVCVVLMFFLSILKYKNSLYLPTMMCTDGMV